VSFSLHEVNASKKLSRRNEDGDRMTNHLHSILKVNIVGLTAGASVAAEGSLF
jgi:hypothetical protein